MQTSSLVEIQLLLHLPRSPQRQHPRLNAFLFRSSSQSTLPRQKKKYKHTSTRSFSSSPSLFICPIHQSCSAMDKISIVMHTHRLSPTSSRLLIALPAFPFLTAARRDPKSFRRVLLHLRRNTHPRKCTQVDDHEEVCFIHSTSFHPRPINASLHFHSPKVEFCGYRQVLECSHCSPPRGPISSTEPTPRPFPPLPFHERVPPGLLSR